MTGQHSWTIQQRQESLGLKWEAMREWETESAEKCGKQWRKRIAKRTRGTAKEERERERLTTRTRRHVIRETRRERFVEASTNFEIGEFTMHQDFASSRCERECFKKTYTRSKTSWRNCVENEIALVERSIKLNQNSQGQTDGYHQKRISLQIHLSRSYIITEEYDRIVKLEYTVIN